MSAAGNVVGTAPLAGSIAARPPGRFAGQAIFDTTLGKPVWWNGRCWVIWNGEPAE